MRRDTTFISDAWSQAGRPSSTRDMPARLPITVRPARTDDLTAVRHIEWESGQRFREVGLDFIADDEPTSVAVLGTYAAAGRAWVAVDGSDTPLGFVIVEEVDGAAHIQQVSVLSQVQGQGIGRALVTHVEEWAGAGGRPAVTLTTFSHVPWNRPLYEHLGFAVLADDEQSPGLRAKYREEAEHGLDPAWRVVMGKDVAATH